MAVEAKKPAHQLTVSDKWIRKGLKCRVVAVALSDPKKPTPQPLIVVYQDGYTPPESTKSDRVNWDQELEVEVGG